MKSILIVMLLQNCSHHLGRPQGTRLWDPRTSNQLFPKCIFPHSLNTKSWNGEMSNIEIADMCCRGVYQALWLVRLTQANNFANAKQSKSTSIKNLYNYIIINFMFSQFTIFEELEDGNYAISEKVSIADRFIVLQVRPLQIWARTDQYSCDCAHFTFSSSKPPVRPTYQRTAL